MMTLIGQRRPQTLQDAIDAVTNGAVLQRPPARTLGDVVGRNVQAPEERFGLFGSPAGQRMPATADATPSPILHDGGGLPGMFRSKSPLHDAPKRAAAPGGFDYEAAKARAEERLGQPDKPSTLENILNALAPTFMALGGDQAGANAFLRDLREGRRYEQSHRRTTLADMIDMEYRDWARRNEAELRASAPFTIGRSRLAYDPASGETKSLYEGDEDFELYAESLGLEPGTPEYFDAVEDYVLRTSGPTAFGRSRELDDHRTSNDLRLEDVRQGNRRDLEGLRQGNRLTLRDVPQARLFAPRERASGSSTRADAPTATGPRGEKMVWNGKAWVEVN